MTRTLLPFVRRFVPLVGREKVRGIVGDQEMRSVALFLALEAMDNLGFVTIGRTPTAKQEAAFEVEGIFVPYLRDAKSGELTHWITHGHTLLQDRKKGLSIQSVVSLVVDCRGGMPGRQSPCSTICARRMYQPSCCTPFTWDVGKAKSESFATCVPARTWMPTTGRRKW